MIARISGREDDSITIHEKASLEGAYAREALTTNVAVIHDALAVPVVEVRDPKAHVTHEAALGSVDSKQLQTLMSRGLSEDAAVDLIIEGLLQPPRV